MAPFSIIQNPDEGAVDNIFYFNNLKSNIKYDFNDVIDDSKLAIANCSYINYTSSFEESVSQFIHKQIVLDTTRSVNISLDGFMDPKRPAVLQSGCLYTRDAAYIPSVIKSENIYTILEDNIPGRGNNDISILKSEAELKDPSFLNVLNSASGEDIWITGEDGFPTLNMQQKGAIKYDGYVKQSEFDEFKKNPVFNKGVVYIPYDVFFNPEKTRDEASSILGGNDGLQNIIKEIESGKRLEFSNIDPVVGFTEIITSVFEFNNIKGLNLKTTALTGFGMADMSILVYYESNGKFAVYKSTTNLEPAKYKGE